MDIPATDDLALLPANGDVVADNDELDAVDLGRVESGVLFLG